MIRNMTNNKESYEDIAQDVFITAYKKLASFDPGAVIFRRGFLPSPRTKAQTR